MPAGNCRGDARPANGPNLGLPNGPNYGLRNGRNCAPGNGADSLLDAGGG